jgi:PAS domain S-box-containing protein
MDKLQEEKRIQSATDFLTDSDNIPNNQDSMEDVTGTDTVDSKQVIKASGRAEEALHNSHSEIERQERLFDTMLSNVGDNIGLFDRQKRFVYANRSLEELWGLSCEQYVGKTMFDLNYPPDTAEFLEQQLEQVFETKKAISGIVPYVGPIGVDGYREYLFNPVIAADGTVEFVAGTSRDITERKRREANLAFLAELMEDFAPLHTAADITRLACAKLIKHLNLSRCLFVEINELADTAEVFYDGSAEDLPSLIGKYSLADFHTIDERNQLTAGNSLVINEVYDTSRPVKAADGFSELHIRALINAPYVSDGRWKFSLCAMQQQPREWRSDEVELLKELSARIYARLERARAEDALRESEKHLQLVLSAGELGAWQLDLASMNLTCSTQGKANFGRSPDESFTYKMFRASIHPEDQNIFTAAASRAIAEAGDYNAEYRCIWPDGSIHWIHATGRVVTEGDGRIKRLVGVTLDITERKQSEEALRASQKLNEDVLDSMAANIAVLDRRGTITLVNKSWRQFALENGADWTLKGVGVGTNYLEICRTVEGENIGDAGTIYQGLSDILNGKREYFSIEYPCHSPTIERWFLLTASPLTHESGGAVVSHQNITERRKAEEAVRESEERFRSLVTASAQVVWITDAEGAIPYAQASWGDFTGQSYEEYGGWGWLDAIHPDDRQRVAKHWQYCLAQRCLYEMEYRLRRHDGIYRDTLARGVPMLTTDGIVREWIGQNTDITERKRAEELLRQSAMQLALINDIAPVYIAHCDREGRFLFVNKSYAERFGLTPEDIIGKHIPEVLGVEAFESFSQYIEIILRGAPVQFEIEVPYETIGKRFMHCSYAPEFDANGKVVGWVAAITDISERRKVEEILRESEERFRNMADHAPMMVWVTEADTTCTYLSQSWYEFTGKTPETGLGFGWLDAIHPEERDYTEQIFLTANEGCEAFRLEYRLRRKDGEYRWMIDSAAPRFGSGNQFLGYIGSVIDITERKQAEEALAQLLLREQAARAEAEDANRLKDEFLATVSHELRTPLNAILGWAQMLQSGKLNESETVSGLQSIYRNAKSQAQLIEDLLDVSRIITGKMRLDICPIHLTQVIHAAIDSLRPAIDSKAINLHTLLSPNVGQVLGDPSRLQQAVWNLLSNAVKFTPEGGEIEVRLERVDSTAQITVRDSGRGISADFLPYIFERFRQADSTSTRKYGGLGLGLSIVRHLIELHGGTVRAVSDGEGSGATFMLQIPQAPITAPEKSHINTGALLHVVSERDSGSECPPELEGLRVLLVDDEPDTLGMLKVALAQCGVDVRISSSAGEALEVLQQWMPDVLVSDIAMPGEDGYSLIKSIRAMETREGRDIPAIALTAYVRVEDRLRVLSDGFQVHVPKPVEPKELISNIASLVNGGQKGISEIE